MDEGDIGGFLRSRREAITPAEVGLPTGQRRRTPGLRRSELAMLAGISVEYLTRIEQGRDRHPSWQVLGALAEALRMSVDDRMLLMQIVKETGGTGVCPGPIPPGQAVRGTVRTLLERMEPSPAYVRNRLGDVLAYTDGFRALFEPLGLFDHQHVNLALYVFADARSRSAFPDWELLADDLVASLRLQLRCADEHSRMLADELSVVGGHEFTSRLSGAPSMPRRSGVTRLVHPVVGELRLSFEQLELPDVDDQSLLVYLPADEAASDALDRVVGRQPRALRALTG